MSALLMAAAATAFIAVYVAQLSAKYRKLYAAEHYRAIADWLPVAKAAALARADDPPSRLSGADPRTLVTPLGLVVAYTVHRESGDYHHHLSVSLFGQPTPQAVGRTFVTFVAERFGWTLTKATLVYSPTGVFHGELVLRASEPQRAWAALPVDTEVNDSTHSQAFNRGHAARFRADPRFSPAAG